VKVLHYYRFIFAIFKQHLNFCLPHIVLQLIMSGRLVWLTRFIEAIISHMIWWQTICHFQSKSLNRSSPLPFHLLARLHSTALKFIKSTKLSECADFDSKPIKNKLKENPKHFSFYHRVVEEQFWGRSIVISCVFENRFGIVSKQSLS